MTSDLAELQEKIRSLSVDDRSQLIRTLIADLDGPAEADVEHAWLDEARRRHREVVKGSVQPIRGEQVFENLRARLKR